MNDSVKKEEGCFRISTISKTLNHRQRLVTNLDVGFFIDALLALANEQEDQNPDIWKFKLYSYIFRHIPFLAKYRITVNGREDFWLKDEMYSALLQGGANKRFYYRYCLLPMKVLEDAGCITTDRDWVRVNLKKLKKFRKGLRKEW